MPYKSEGAGAVEPVLPVKLGPGTVSFAQGVRAGRWLFATGLLAQDFKTGISKTVTVPVLAGAPPAQREATIIFDHLENVLTTGGTSRDNIVRLDQFFTSVASIAPYQATRRNHLGGVAPASTSVVMDALPFADASIQIDALAVIPGPEFQPRAVAKPDIVSISGPSPSVVVGDFVFISGQLATADPGVKTRDGLPEEACVPTTAFWGGVPIKVETEYVLHRRVSPALERAGSSIRNVVKAQVYLTNPHDFFTFRQVWKDYFGDDMPATTIILAPNGSMGLSAARVEINLIALRNDSIATRKATIHCDIVPAYAEFPAAVKAGDILFLSGLMANDADGAAEDVKATENQPLYGSSIEAEGRVILRKARKICEAAGTSLENIVRAQHFHGNVSGFSDVYNAWRQELGPQALPFSVIGAPGPMSFPGCSLLMDLWVYAPHKN